MEALVLNALLKLQARMPGEPDLDHPRPERLLRGDPQRETWNLLSQAVAGAQVDGGVWRCEPGHWRIAMGANEIELFTVLAGRCRVHAADGSFQECRPGEALIIPAGFVGSFEVLETVTKTYMIVSA
jgi:uncharacterized cupin superfamily protein